MERGQLSPIEKAALVILSLGKDTAAQVMKNLSKHEVGRISRALQKVSDVPREEQLKVVQEFQKLLSASETLLVDGESFAREMIGKAFGAEAVTEGDIFGSGKKESLQSLMADVPHRDLLEFVKKEHPQTTAVLLSEVHPEQASAVLQEFSEEDQTEILLRISNLRGVRPEVIDEVREVLRKELLSRQSQQNEVGGAKAAAEILSMLPKDKEARVFSDLEELSPDLADELRELMFTFEDLSNLTDKDLQMLISKAPRDQIVLSFKLCSSELRNNILANVSSRAAEQLQDDFEALGKVKRKDVEQAQKSLIDLAKQLESEGLISLNLEASSEEYI